MKNDFLLVGSNGKKVEIIKYWHCQKIGMQFQRWSSLCLSASLMANHSFEIKKNCEINKIRKLSIKNNSENNMFSIPLLQYFIWRGWVTAAIVPSIPNSKFTCYLVYTFALSQNNDFKLLKTKVEAFCFKHFYSNQHHNPFYFLFSKEELLKLCFKYFSLAHNTKISMILTESWYFPINSSTKFCVCL